MAVCIDTNVFICWGFPISDFRISASKQPAAAAEVAAAIRKLCPLKQEASKAENWSVFYTKP